MRHLFAVHWPRQAAAPLSILRDVLLIVFSILMPMFFGVTGIFWGAPIADVLAARESGLAQEFISGINSDENAVMRELYLSTSVVQQAIAAQDRAINLIADKGSCVIVGRAADYVLRNRANVVRVFIHAPQAYRVKKVMEMYGDTEQEGRKSIARSDAARSAYYKSVSGRTWGDPHQYELSVDSSIGPEKTAELICSYIGQTG